MWPSPPTSRSSSPAPSLLSMNSVSSTHAQPPTPLYTRSRTSSISSLASINTLASVSTVHSTASASSAHSFASASTVVLPVSEAVGSRVQMPCPPPCLKKPRGASQSTPSSPLRWDNSADCDRGGGPPTASHVLLPAWPASVPDQEAPMSRSSSSSSACTAVLPSNDAGPSPFAVHPRRHVQFSEDPPLAFPTHCSKSYDRTPIECTRVGSEWDLRMPPRWGGSLDGDDHDNDNHDNDDDAEPDAPRPATSTVRVDAPSSSGKQRRRDDLVVPADAGASDSAAEDTSSVALPIHSVRSFGRLAAAAIGPGLALALCRSLHEDDDDEDQAEQGLSSSSPRRSKATGVASLSPEARSPNLSPARRPSSLERMDADAEVSVEEAEEDRSTLDMAMAELKARLSGTPPAAEDTEGAGEYRSARGLLWRKCDEEEVRSTASSRSSSVCTSRCDSPTADVLEYPEKQRVAKAGASLAPPRLPFSRAASYDVSSNPIGGGFSASGLTVALNAAIKADASCPTSVSSTREPCERESEREQSRDRSSSAPSRGTLLEAPSANAPSPSLAASAVPASQLKVASNVTHQHRLLSSSLLHSPNLPPLDSSCSSSSGSESPVGSCFPSVYGSPSGVDGASSAPHAGKTSPPVSQAADVAIINDTSSRSAPSELSAQALERLEGWLLPPPTSASAEAHQKNRSGGFAMQSPSRTKEEEEEEESPADVLLRTWGAQESRLFGEEEGGGALGGF